MSKTIEEIIHSVGYTQDGTKANLSFNEAMLIAQRYAQSQTQYLIKSLDAKQEQIDKLIKKYDRREIDFKSQTQELQEHNAELVELVERCKDVICAYNNWSPTPTGKEIIEAVNERITKNNHLKSNTNGKL